MLHQIISNKSISDLINDIKFKAKDFDFIVRYVFDMAEDFRSHGVVVSADFEYYSVMICNPEKAYKSILANPVRGAVLLPPKQIVVYKNTGGQTIMAYTAPGKDELSRIIPDDKDLQNALSKTGNKILEFIETVK